MKLVTHFHKLYLLKNNWLTCETCLMPSLWLLPLETAFTDVVLVSVSASSMALHS